uniref:IBB domain-containing protein n=1 Tax=Rhizophora mucronata TaxID=61149 RepID=A0A2P2LDW9_RHIMU
MSLRPNERTNVRRNRYKVAVDAEEGRRRRENKMVAIRKDKRGENLRKRRSEGLQAQLQHQQPADSVFVSAFDSQLESVADMLRGVYSEDRKFQLEATTCFRKLLSIRLPLINEVSVAVPCFVAFLARDDFPQLQVEINSLWYNVLVLGSFFIVLVLFYVSS